MEKVLSLQFRGIPDSVFIISFLILSVLIVLVFMLRKNRRNTRRAVFSMLLVEYVFLMFCSTIVCRKSHPELSRLELMPFWNYQDVLLSGKPMHYWEVLLNIALYTPIGFLFGCLYKRIVPTVLICVLLSVITEVLQYVLHRGLCETDDVIHNSIGGLLGFLFLNIVIKCFKKLKYKNI